MATSIENMDAETNGVLDFPKHLRAYLQRMRDDELTHDVVFVVDNLRFPAHRCLMAATSPVLRSMLTNGMKETSERDIVLKEVNVEAWKVVLDYMYTGRMNLLNVDKALQYLSCADWLQMEDLVDVISAFIERNLDRGNCYKILITTDRPSLTRLRAMAMKTIVEGFHRLWTFYAFLRLPFAVVVDILRCSELVVRSELDVFLAVIRWIVWSGNSAMSSATNTAIASKTCELIAEHTGLHLSDVEVPETDARGAVNYGELFECVDINKFTNADMQIVAVICRRLCQEAQMSHGMDLSHVREFGEKAVEKLILSDISKPSIPVALHKRVLHYRNDMVFTFSHRFDTLQMRTGLQRSMRSRWFQDKRCNVMWSAEVWVREKIANEQCGYLNIYLYRRSGLFGEREESEFSHLIYVEVGNRETFSRATNTNNTRSVQGGKTHDIVPLSVLEGEDTINVGVVIYFQAK